MSPCRVLAVGAGLLALTSLAVPAALAEAQDVLSPVGTWPAGPCYASGGEGRLACYGEGGFLVTADVTDPAVPVELGRVKLSTFVTHVAVKDDVAFVETADRWWRVFDVVDPAAPQQIGALFLPDELADVVFDGNLAYLGTRGAGLVVVDVADPAAPVVVGTWSESTWVLHLEVRDGYAYLAAYGGDFQILDVSDPTHPVTIYADAFPGYGLDIVLVESYAYVFSSYAHIYDISDPAHPVLVDEVGFSSSVRCVAQEGSLLVGTNSTSYSRLVTIDTTVPAAPVELGSLAVGGTLDDLVIEGGLVLAGNGEFGMRLIEVADPATLFLAGTCDVFPGVLHVPASGSLRAIPPAAGRTSSCWMWATRPCRRRSAASPCRVNPTASPFTTAWRSSAARAPDCWSSTLPIRLSRSC